MLLYLLGPQCLGVVSTLFRLKVKLEVEGESWPAPTGVTKRTRGRCQSSLVCTHPHSEEGGYCYIIPTKVGTAWTERVNLTSTPLAHIDLPDGYRCESKQGLKFPLKLLKTLSKSPLSHPQKLCVKILRTTKASPLLAVIWLSSDTDSVSYLLSYMSFPVGFLALATRKQA